MASSLRCGFFQKLPNPSRTFSSFSSSPSPIRCGLRGGARRPLWRGRVLSTEAIQAVQSLKLASRSSSSSPLDRTAEIFRSKLGRLLKGDLVAVLAELRRQNEWELALQVFAFIKKEVWYKPDLSLYSDMILMLGKNKLIEAAEELFSELREEGLQPDTRAYTEMIGAFLQVDRVEKAMDIYKLMKDSGCNPDKLTLTILIRNLEQAGESELASSVRKDCEEYIDFPEKFLEEVDRKYVSDLNRSLCSFVKELMQTPRRACEFCKCTSRLISRAASLECEDQPLEEGLR